MEIPPTLYPRGLLLPSQQEFPFHSQGNNHAEICFLNWFQDHVLTVLSPREELNVTWYMSWSPCVDCTEQVTRFLAKHHNLSLAIFSSRIYFLGDPNYQQKLRRLVQEGAQLATMGLPGESGHQRRRRACGSALLWRLLPGPNCPLSSSDSEFKKCWNTFVYNDGQPFRPWKKLHENFRFQDSKLQEILR